MATIRYNNDLCTIANFLTWPNFIRFRNPNWVFMEIFMHESTRRIGDQNVLRKVDAPMDWSLVLPLLKAV